MVKTPKKIFFSGTKRPMTLNLGMHHWVLEYYQVCSNDDPGLTMTYFTARLNLVPYAFVWEKGKTGFFRNYCRLWFDTDNRWPKWQEVSVDIKTSSPGGCMLLSRGFIHVLNHEKNVKNQTSKRFLWNLQQMGKVIRPFCWHQNFVPWGISAPAPGLYTCIKSYRKLYKIRLQRLFFLNL